MATKKIKAPAINTLRNDAYDLIVKSYNRKSKFYNEDCDHLWAHLSKKSAEELREIMARKRGYMSVTQAEIDRNCDFRGMF